MTAIDRTAPAAPGQASAKVHVDDVARAYDAWAPVYDVDANPLVALDDVVTPRLFLPREESLRGREALDAGCGTGRHAAKLVAAGARVVGVDASAGMLAQARARVPEPTLGDPRAPGATFQMHDLRAPLPFASARFDVVVCTLVLEHAASLDAPIAELARVTRPGGVIVVSDIHPRMRAGTQANFTDPVTGADVLPPSHPHAIGDYVRAAVRASLAVDVVLEHEGMPWLVERTPRARKYVGRPMLAAFRFVRLR